MASAKGQIGFFQVFPVKMFAVAPIFRNWQIIVEGQYFH